MRHLSREALSMAVIRALLGAGGGFLSAAFILEAYLRQSFMIPAAVFVLAAGVTAAYLFGRVRPHYFLLATLVWLALLFPFARP